MGYERAVKSYRKTEVETADQLKLIILCYEEAIKAIRQAKAAYENGRFESKALYLTKAGNIIGELSGSLNTEKGGIIAANLGSLYGYMLRRLTQGDVEKDMNAFDEVARLLNQLLEAWQEIATSKENKVHLSNRYRNVANYSRGITA